MALLARLARVPRHVLAILMVLALAGAPLRALPCADTDGAAHAGHHHHHGDHRADCAGCCCDCAGCTAQALPESGFMPMRLVADAAYGHADATLPHRAPQPEPDPPRPAALS
jgi:hypothetical protein